MYSVSIKRPARKHDPRNACPVENAIGKLYAIAFAEHKIRLSTLVGDKHQRIASGYAHLRAEGMIVSVPTGAKVTIRVGDFSTDVHSPPLNHLSHEQIDIPLRRHFLRGCQVGSYALYLRKRHAVQTVPVPELESAQCQSRECE
jgi:hypothetical protein